MIGRLKSLLDCSLASQTETPTHAKDAKEIIPVLVSCLVRVSARLLGSALDTLSTWVSVLIILVHCSRALGSCLLSRIHVFEIDGFCHCIRWWCSDSVRGWDDGLESLECGRVGGEVLLGELHVELNVHVSEVVMTI